MSFQTNLADLIDDTHRARSFREIAGASPAVLGGLRHVQASKLMEALDIKTIAELAGCKYVLWAQAITHLSQHEKVDTSSGPTLNPSLAAILDEKWRKKRLRELAKAPPSIFAGLSEKEAKLLSEAIEVKTVEDLATSRFVLMAQVIANLAKYAQHSEQPSRPEPVKQAA